MRDKIAFIVKELQFVTSDEIKTILGDARKKTIDHNLDKMESNGEVIKLLPDENSIEQEGLIGGPNLEGEENIEIRELLVEKGFSERVDVIKWNIVGNRLIADLTNNVNKLIEDIEGLYKDPKSLELDYFDYSIRYHEIYGLLNEKIDTEVLKSFNELLEKCRLFLDKLDYRETP
ncbi:MAG: hypothetical protein V3V92_04745 [Candidatus Hydrothermarchaeales archaeon]